MAFSLKKRKFVKAVTVQFIVMDDRKLILHFIGSEPLVLSAVAEKDGVPAQTFRKEIMRVGEFHKAADGISFKVTRDTLDHWAATFSRMKANGVKVPVPKVHTSDPEANRGWVHDMFRQDDSLIAVIELIGDDALKLAKRTDVSIYSPAELTDGEGETYRRPIEHVALATDPVITGLGDWEPIAASRLELQLEKTMDWTKIAAALGIENVTDENADELICSAVGTLVKERDEAKTALALSNATPVAVDPTLLEVVGDNRKMKLDSLVPNRITPKVRDSLADLFIKNGLELSLQRKDKTFDGVVAALAENNPVELTERSGQQVVTLSRGGDEGKSGLVEDAKARAKAAKA